MGAFESKVGFMPLYESDLTKFMRDFLQAHPEEIDDAELALMWIRWVDTDNTGSDGIYAIDDFRIEFASNSTAPASLPSFITSFL